MEARKRRRLKVAALERSDKVAGRGHVFAVLKRGYTHRAVIVQETGGGEEPAHRARGERRRKEATQG
jgi:hypothetical protein